MKLINCSTFYPHFRFCFRNHYREERPGLWQQERPVARLLGGELRGGRDHHGEWRGHAENIFYELNIFFHFQACAPRYIYYVYKNRRDPVGICYTGRLNSNQFRPFRPCVGQGKVEPLSNMLTVSGLRPSLHLVFAKFDEKGTYRYLFHRKK